MSCQRCFFQRQSGLTLVELMISITLSLVLLAGVFVLFEGNKTSFRLQEGVSAIQDSGRFAISQIKKDVEIAGFGGCITRELQQYNPQIISSDPVDYVTRYRDGVRIVGFDGPASVDGEAVVAGDALQVTGPLTGEYFFVNGPVFPNVPVVVRGDAGNFDQYDYVQITDCSGSEIFELSGDAVVTGSAPSNTSTLPRAEPLTRKFGADAIVTPLVTRTYFVGTSAGTNRSGDAVPALYVSETRSNAPSAAVQVNEVLQGIEDLRVVYAMDSNADGVADDFRDASEFSGVNDTDWADVIGVRVSLLANSIERSAEASVSYRYLPVSSVQISPASDDRLLRQEFAVVGTLRNRAE
jgi:type IV pilus assembly protein PilW